MGQGNTVLFERFFQGFSKLLLEELANVVSVNVADGRSFEGNFVCVDKVGALQQPLDFLARSHPTLV